MRNIEIKLVKLDARHRLYHRGYKYAYRCVGFSKERADLEGIVRKLEKATYCHNTCFGSKVNRDDHGGYLGYLYWIGLKNESTHTMIALMKDYV